MFSPFHNTTVTAAKCDIIFRFTNEQRQSYYSIHRNEVWAFIDMQNLHKGVQERGGRIDWLKLRNYLKDMYNVQQAIGFMGYIKENQGLYKMIQTAGFSLSFRSTKNIARGIVDGGNIDTDLVACVMDNKDRYDGAIIIADDSNYCSTVERLQRQNKLELIISSHPMNQTSLGIKQLVRRHQIVSIHSMRPIIEQR